MGKEGYFEAIATLVGTVIGAGVLGVPYVIAKVGLLAGIIQIILIGSAILLTNLHLGEVILRTPGKHQLTGYAERYLGKWGRRIMTFSMVFGIYGALIAYIIGGGTVLSTIFGGNPLFFSLLFFIIFSIVVYIGLKLIKGVELYLGLAFLTIVLAIVGFSWNKMSLSNMTTFNPAMIFFPYGAILFAFMGAAALPEMKEILIKERKRLKKAIIIGSLIPLFIYLIFAVVVVGVTGANTSEVATVGLGEVLGEKMVVFGNLFAFFAMATSFLTLGLALKEMYNYDYGLNKGISWALTCFVPLFIFLWGVTGFIRTISIAGSIAGGTGGVLIVLMFWKAKKKGKRKPEYTIFSKTRILGWILILIFILGIINTVVNLV